MRKCLMLLTLICAVVLGITLAPSKSYARDIARSYTFHLGATNSLAKCMEGIPLQIVADLIIAGDITQADINFLKSIHERLYWLDTLDMSQASGKNLLIPEGFLSDCHGIRTLKLPEGVKRVGDGAFSDCIMLDSITFPKTLEEIGKGPFNGCPYVKHIDMRSPAFVVEAGMLLSADRKRLLFILPGAEWKTITLPKTVTSVAAFAFQGGCESIVIPNAIDIEDYAFYRCHASIVYFTSSRPVFVPQNALPTYGNRISDRYDMLLLYSGAAPDFARDGTRAYKVSALPKRYASLAVPEGGRASISMSFPGLEGASYQWTRDRSSEVIEGATSTTLTIDPVELKDAGVYRLILTIGDEAYYISYASLEVDVELNLKNGNGLKDALNARGLDYLFGVHSLTISGPITQADLNFLGDKVLSSLTTLDMSKAYGTNLTIPEAFINSLYYETSDKLKTVKLPKGVSSLGAYAFAGCEGLESIDLPEVTSIGKLALSGCKNLRRVSMPKAQSIGYSAFFGCTSLERIELPPGLNRMANNPFAGCASLTAIDNKSDAFVLDSGLLLSADKKTVFCALRPFGRREISLPETVIEIASDAFKGYRSLEKITMPGVVRIGDGAFSGCALLKEITMPNVRLICQEAFLECISLKSVRLEAQGPFSIARSAFDMVPKNAAFIYSGASKAPHIFERNVVAPDGKKLQTERSNDALPAYLFPLEGLVIRDGAKIMSAAKGGKTIATADAGRRFVLMGVNGNCYSILWDDEVTFVSIDDISLRFNVPVIGTALKDVEAWYGYVKGESFNVYGRDGKAAIVHGEWGAEWAVPAQRVNLQ